MSRSALGHIIVCRRFWLNSNPLDWLKHPLFWRSCVSDKKWPPGAAAPGQWKTNYSISHDSNISCYKTNCNVVSFYSTEKKIICQKKCSIKTNRWEN